MVRQPKPDAVKKIDRDRTRQKNYDAMMKKSKINKEESESESESEDDNESDNEE
jgi:hypothetical protein